MLSTRPVDGDRCRFRTAWETTLHPVTLESVRLDVLDRAELVGSSTALAAIRLRLRPLPGSALEELAIPDLTFFLGGDAGIAHALYEAIFRSGVGVGLGSPGESRWVPDARLVPVGFADDEGLVDFPHVSLLGYRLLMEYFTFPEKYLFVKVEGLGERTQSVGEEGLELSLLLGEVPAELEERLAPDQFQLGCVPAVNLFPQIADPITVDHTRFEHLVQPNARSPYAYEVHSIEAVQATTPGQPKARTLRPFYGLRASDRIGDEPVFWQTTRRLSPRKDDVGTDVYLRLVDRHFDPAATSGEVLHVRTLCTNRELASRLPLGDPRGDFQAEGLPTVSRIRALRKPTSPCRDHLANDSRWRFVSHVSLNWLSLGSTSAESAAGDDGKALAALQDILRLYDFAGSAVTRQRISGLIRLASRRVTRRLVAEGVEGFARGLEVEVELDEEKYTGSGAFLFASILEHFFGQFASINSFTQTVARTRQREGVLKRWPPRAGAKPML